MTSLNWRRYFPVERLDLLSVALGLAALLAGRIHSYHDTQLSRLGGPNFHEIPINAPIVQVHNNQRDGIHRQAIHRGAVAYEPNSLAGGCPFQAGVGHFGFGEVQGLQLIELFEMFEPGVADLFLFELLDGGGVAVDHHGAVENIGQLAAELAKKIGLITGLISR